MAELTLYTDLFACYLTANLKYLKVFCDFGVGALHAEILSVETAKLLRYFFLSQSCELTKTKTKTFVQQKGKKVNA